MSTKHTPGLWALSRTPTYWKVGDPRIKSRKGTRLIAAVSHANPNAEADAKLIAAAPDLLAALQAVLNSCLDSQGLADAYKQARAAIAKAEGKQ